MEYFEVFIKIVEVICKIVSAINTGGRFIFYQRSHRVPRLTDWIRRAVNAWGMDIGSEKLVSFSDR